MIDLDTAAAEAFLDERAGSRIARAWLAAQSAADTAKDKDAALRPAIFRTTLVERFDDGWRFTATDTYWTACAWVGDIVDREEEIPRYHDLPAAGELPLTSVSVVDHEYRIRDLLSFVVRRTAKVDATHPDTPLVVAIASGRSPSTPTLDPLFDRDRVLVEIPEIETVAGYVNEVEYPNVARIHDQHRPEDSGSLEHVQLNPDLLRKLAKSCSTVGAEGLRFAFHGDPTKPLSWSVVQPAEAVLFGLVMPQRPDDYEPPAPPMTAEEMTDFVDAVADALDGVTLADGETTVTVSRAPRRKRGAEGTHSDQPGGVS